MRPSARGSAVYGLTGDRISYRWPHILPTAAYPIDCRISCRRPHILPPATYPTDCRISYRPPHILPVAPPDAPWRSLPFFSPLK